MRYLFDDWDKIKKSLNNKFIALFLDYDGTISPIVDKPEMAFIPKKTKQLLCKLLKSPRCKLAIISGRALEDIKKKVNIPGIVYVGNHGLEIEGPKIKFKSPISLRCKRILRSIKDELTVKLAAIKGVVLEDKGLSLSVHYRLVDRSLIPKVKTVLHEATILYTVRDKIKINLGKKVFEVRSALDWDKGKVVLWLLARWEFSLKDKNIVPVYLGDDVTDEDAFRVLRNKGIAVFIGEPKKSNAQYYLKDTQEVGDFLSCIVKDARVKNS